MRNTQNSNEIILDKKQKNKKKTLKIVDIKK